MFQDEARFGRINDPKRCWSPKRTRPTVGKQIIREYTYAYGAVSPRDGAADFLILPVMTAVAMKVFLDELARRHDGQYILMIYDGAPCHSPGALKHPGHHDGPNPAAILSATQPGRKHMGRHAREVLRQHRLRIHGCRRKQNLRSLPPLRENTETVRSITAFSWIVDNL